MAKVQPRWKKKVRVEISSLGMLGEVLYHCTSICHTASLVNLYPSLGLGVWGFVGGRWSGQRTAPLLQRPTGKLRAAFQSVTAPRPKIFAPAQPADHHG